MTSLPTYPSLVFTTYLCNVTLKSFLYQTQQLRIWRTEVIKGRFSIVVRFSFLAFGLKSSSLNVQSRAKKRNLTLNVKWLCRTRVPVGSGIFKPLVLIMATCRRPRYWERGMLKQCAGLGRFRWFA